MTAERWQQIQTLFLDVLERPDDERGAFLEAACRGDAALYEEVASLLEASEEAERYLFDLARRSGVPAFADEPDADAMAGRRVGHYRLRERIGHGGMGTVFLAERADDQFHKQVAIKLLPCGMDTALSRLRFLTERQILARLEHPGIARLLDGGVTDEGTPYFVMEYVDGMPIDAYCDAGGFDVEDRLDLFRQVCEVVQFAHQNLIVHRDLKPDNILVDARGQVKLLDFGIAKLLDEARAEGGAATATRLGHRAATPGYASPEQLRGRSVTTASDVYGLGVVLYELLAGRRPFDLAGKTPTEVEHVICEDVPPPPSAAVSRDVADPVRRARQLRGDLDTIVLKALRKVPGRRYASVAELSEDVRRYQTHLPVAARKDTFGYRLARLVRRHRIGVAATAAVVVLILALVALAVSYAVTTRSQATAIARERDRAEHISAFLVDLLGTADPREGAGVDVTVGELLERGVEDIGEELAGEPEMRADLLNVVGRVHTRLGQYDRAQALLEEALALYGRTVGQDHVDVADALYNLALAHHLKGQTGRADTLARRALRLFQARYGDEHVDVARAMDLVAENGSGGPEEAERLQRRALAMRRELLGDDHPEVATGLNNLAMLLTSTGGYDEAEAMMHEVLAIDRKNLGDDHPDLANTLNNLAWIASFIRGDHQEAERLLREGVRIFREALGDDHPDLAVSLNNLGMAVMKQADYPAAESLFHSALRIQREALGEDHWRLGFTTSNLGRLHELLGDGARAERYQRRALAIRRAARGDDHVETAQSLHGLGALLSRRGQYDEAERLLEEALAWRRGTLGDDHAETLTSLREVAILQGRRGRLAEAEALLRDVVARRRDGPGAVAGELADDLLALGRVLHEAGRAGAAVPVLREALARRRETSPPRHWHVAEAQGALGAALAASGRYAEAERLLLEAYEALAAQWGAPDPRTRTVAGHLVTLYERWGRRGEATRWRATPAAGVRRHEPPATPRDRG